MSESPSNVLLRTSPHLRFSPSVDVIMRNVVYALLPVCGYAVYQFGISVLALLIVCTGTCLATEHVICRLAGKASSTRDWSVTITGLLLALTLPPGFPLWMAAVAAIFGVGVGKMFFGGLGFNVMNPALVGRAFAQAAFTAPITTWVPSMAPGRFTEFIPSTLTLPFLKPVPIDDWLARVAIDGWSGATPLALMKFEQVPTASIDLLFGSVTGSAGETSAILILLCGLYLIARRMMSWQIPVSILLISAATSAFFHYAIDAEVYPGPLFTLCSGGLMLGAVFMATDMVASPVTRKGIWIYGALIGFVTVIIRLFGGLNEGVMYAILLANACSPLISAVTQPRIYGAKPAKEVKAA
jgi:Na+-translocating ferredoxin:NAD+ oxidoreductase subunit D